MPAASDGKKYLVGIWDDLTGWEEYTALREADAVAMAKVTYET